MVTGLAGTNDTWTLFLCIMQLPPVEGGKL